MAIDNMDLKCLSLTKQNKMRYLILLSLFIASCAKEKPCINIDGHWKVTAIYENGFKTYTATDSVYDHYFIIGDSIAMYKRKNGTDSLYHNGRVNCEYVRLVSTVELNYGFWLGYPYQFRVLNKII